ncbi:hypothetical protein MLD38_002840 [Melastoma candidum]|uniref:Uncharacterized protein n=1 Tax=Melastoma candidum TaxID=119954 RepID=A0ACB9S1A6_9MYRT|nr:hypothetical protein MLD38_002840 [Melastoma candidum]
MWMEVILNLQRRNPEVDKGPAENSMIMAWLISSMHPSIGNTFMFLHIAKEIWDSTQKAYSDAKDIAQVFDIKVRLWEARQRSRDVTEYYLEMVTLWQELDSQTNDRWECTQDAFLYRQKVNQERVFEFLGLHRSFDDVRSRLLGRRPFPVLDDVFGEVRREETRRKVMLNAPIESPVGSLDSTAVAAQKGGNSTMSCNNSGPGYSSNSFGRQRPSCDHCKRVGHTRQTCWVLHGKPPNWKPR